jgi:hypothetical protein
MGSIAAHSDFPTSGKENLNVAKAAIFGSLYFSAPLEKVDVADLARRLRIRFSRTT